MEEALSFFWLVWFTKMELGGRNGDTGFRIDDPYSPFCFYLRVGIRISFRGFHFDHQ
jgi:hypothetical protein